MQSSSSESEVSSEVMESIARLDLPQKKLHFRFVQRSLVGKRGVLPYRLADFPIFTIWTSLHIILSKYPICCLEQIESHLFRLIREEDSNFPFYSPTHPQREF
jgi:hypothetical protein